MTIIRVRIQMAQSGSSAVAAMYVCVCKAVSDQDIRRAVAQGAQCFEDLQARTSCTTCCGCCEAEAREQLGSSLESHRRVAALPVAA
ncbi:MAG: (2Fe-2S)-binding protein [Rhodanobacteraceae bacterium]